MAGHGADTTPVIDRAPRRQSVSRTSQSSGKKRRSTVVRRYATPGEPPVPVRVPISRAAISAWWWRQRADPLVVVDEQLGDVVPGGAQRVAGVVAVEVGERGEPGVAVLRQARGPCENASYSDGPGRRVAAARPGAALAREPLDLAELARLEAGRGRERVAELQEALGAHRLEHVELVEQQPLDRDDAAQPRRGDVRAAVGELVARRGQLVQDQLEPELVGLVDDDEQQLVVGAGRDRALELQQVVDQQVASRSPCRPR